MSGFVMRDAHRDPDVVSRTTSVSRRSTVSRSQTLIRKNIAPHDLRPSDVIIERFVAWKAIVKQLIGTSLPGRLFHLWAGADVLFPCSLL
jgi:hypothetical protein